MEQGRGVAAAAHGDVVEDVEAEADVVQEVAAVGGAGDVARVVAGSVAAATDLEEKGVADSDSAVPDLVVTASGDALDVRVEAGDKQVVDVEEEAVGMKRKLAMTGFTDPYESDSNVDDMMWTTGTKSPSLRRKPRRSGRRGKFRCPYYTTKPKPKDGLYEYLMSHEHGLSTSADDIKIREKHAALLKALGPI
ncbi:hypothetical protein ZWY2020_056822 [Hordeum vulgare]|nr:hypothetical protein ZWY2020_056822 [Hordeum vulgare]